MTQIRTIKAAGDWELDVLAIPFGNPLDKDSDGEFFTESTDLWEEQFPAPPVVYYHGFDPVRKAPTGDPQLIGRTVSREKRTDGVWLRVVLDKANELAKRVWDAAQKGIAVASSGSIAHLHRVGRDGQIRIWPLAEISIWDNDGSRPQANRHAIAVPVMKMLYQQAGITLPDDIEPESEADAIGATAQRAEAAKAPTTDDIAQENPTMSDNTLTKEDVAAVVADAIKAEREARQAEEQRQADEKMREAEIAEEAVKAARAEWEKEQAEARRLPSDQQAPYVAKFNDTWKYDNLTAGDQAFLLGVMNGAGRTPSESAVKALALKLDEDKTEVGGRGRLAMKAAGMYDGKGALKANELDHSTQSGFGDEWVGVAYSTQIWEAVRSGGRIVPNIPTIEVPAGMESMTIPLEGADPTYYKVAQATAKNSTTGIPNATVTDSKLATANKSLTLSKMGARVMWSGEMQEDSLIPWVSQLRRQLEVAGAEQLEHAVIDGDNATAASTNINDIASTAAQGGTELYLLFDGFRVSPLVTTTANSRSANGGLSDTDFLETAYLMGTAGVVGADRTRVGFVIDPSTHKKSVQLASVKTRDVFLNATIENGMLADIWGYPVFTSYFMHFKDSDRLANTAGKVDQDTAANNTTGAILAVRWDQWLLGYRRRMTMEVTRRAESDSYEIVALMRLGLAQRDTEASAITYNVGV